MRKTTQWALPKASLLLSATLILASGLSAKTWFVDSGASGNNNGTSWADAWTTVKTMAESKGIVAGDVVYISGGPSGSTRTYSATTYAAYPGQWLLMVDGVTYQIGQDAAHNGTAIFDGQNGSYWLAQGIKNVVISGDAGDGQRHFRLINSQAPGNGESWDHSRASYIDFGQTPGPFDFNPAVNVEIDHCAFALNGANSDHVSYGLFSGTTYDTSTFHDNYLSLPRNPTNNGFGPDGLQWTARTAATGGFSIYNNTFVTFPSSSFTGSQHQDGWQGSGGSYIKVYGNTFKDISNYCIYPEPYANGFSHMRIYNNVCILTYSNSTQAIVISGTSSVPANDVIVADNLADGYSIPFTFRNPGLSPSPNTFINCQFYNNISVNGGANIIDANVTTGKNVTLTATQAALSFAKYSAGSLLNDYHLLPTAALLIGAGSNLSSFFTTDFSGATRTQWDVGPYSYNGVITTIAPSNAVTSIDVR